MSGLTGQTVQVIVCSPQLLSQFLSFANGVTADQVSTVLCALNSTQFNELAAELRQQLLPVSDLTTVARSHDTHS